jgi:hypothetical protein
MSEKLVSQLLYKLTRTSPSPSILAAGKLAQFEGGKRVPATVSAISDAVRWAEEVMKVIDERWPAGR